MYLSGLLLGLLAVSCQGNWHPRWKNHNEIPGFSAHGRTARSVYLAQAGAIAAKSLLRGAKESISNQPYKTFLKQGTFGDAVEAFFSVRPTDVRIVGVGTRGVRYEGKAGNRNIELRFKDRKIANGKPAITISDPIRRNLQEVIVFKKKLK